MTAGRLRAATGALAVSGAAIAAYLAYTKVTSTSIMCPTTGCATVARSTYSELAGVPVAFLGVAMYLTVAGLALNGAARALHLQSVVIAVALAFSVYLLIAQLAVIGAVCVWCLSSDAIIVLLVLVGTLREANMRLGRRSCP